MNFQIRKPISHLTHVDFQYFKIWEFATGEEGRTHLIKVANDEATYTMQDESWVRPVDGEVIQRNKRSLIVEAKFITPIGLEIVGAICVSTLGNVQIGPGAFFVADSFIAIPALPPRGSAMYHLGDNFDLEAFGTLEAIKQNKLRAQTGSLHIPTLGIPSEEIFPLRFELALNIEGETNHRYGMFQNEQ